MTRLLPEILKYEKYDLPDGWWLLEDNIDVIQKGDFKIYNDGSLIEVPIDESYKPDKNLIGKLAKYSVWFMLREVIDMRYSDE